MSDLTNEQVLWAMIALLVLLILYYLFKQNFVTTPLYTSGATQRYASEFSSTNQEPSIYNSLAFTDVSESEHFENDQRLTASNIAKTISKYEPVTNLVNRYAGDKAKIATNNPKSLLLETELFGNLREHTLNM